LFILDHNLGTRNARKSIEGSKDSDSSLVSNENLSKILLSSGWALGQATWDKMAKNLPHLCRHSQKTWNPKLKNFFSLQAWRLAKSFEGLNSSLAQSAEEVCHC